MSDDLELQMEISGEGRGASDIDNGLSVIRHLHLIITDGDTSD